MLYIGNMINVDCNNDELMIVMIMMMCRLT